MSVEDRRFLALIFAFGMLMLFSAAPKWVRVWLGVLLMVTALVVGLTHDPAPHL